MSALRPLYEFAVDLAIDLAVEKLQGLQRQRAASARWAQTPAPVRACPSCREVAYTPGQLACTKCGARL